MEDLRKERGEEGGKKSKSGQQSKGCSRAAGEEGKWGGC